MAYETALEAVIHQPGVAVRAGQPIAALAAERQRRIAAPIEEQQRLLAALERHLHGLRQPRRHEAPGRRTFLAQIDRLDHRHVLAAEALRQMQAPVARAPGVDLGLDRGGRGGEQHGNLGDVAAHHRHVAGMVMDAVLLLVGGIVLLIHDDEAEIRIGQEQRRAGAHDHAHLVRRRRLPGAGALARRKLRVPLGRPHPEALGEAVEHLGGERDLGHQDQDLPTAPHRLRHRLEIDLRLARSGDAVDERDRIAGLRHGRPQRIGSLALRRREIRRHVIGLDRQRQRLGRQHQGLERSFIDQAVDDTGRDAGLLGGLALWAREAIGQAARARARAPASCAWAAAR